MELRVSVNKFWVAKSLALKLCFGCGEKTNKCANALDIFNGETSIWKTPKSKIKVAARCNKSERAITAEGKIIRFYKRKARV